MVAYGVILLICLMILGACVPTIVCDDMQSHFTLSDSGPGVGNVKYIQTRSRLECASICGREEGCKSFFYYKNNKTCYQSDAQLANLPSMYLDPQQQENAVQTTTTEDPTTTTTEEPTTTTTESPTTTTTEDPTTTTTEDPTTTTTEEPTTTTTGSPTTTTTKDPTTTTTEDPTTTTTEEPTTTTTPPCAQNAVAGCTNNNGFKSDHGVCYSCVQTLATYDEAQITCCNLGGHLLTIPDGMVFNQVKGECGTNAYPWIDGRGGVAHDGQPLPWVDWFSGPPGPTECSAISQNDMKMIKYTCSSQQFFVCQIDL